MLSPRRSPPPLGGSAGNAAASPSASLSRAEGPTVGSACGVAPSRWRSNAGAEMVRESTAALCDALRRVSAVAVLTGRSYAFGGSGGGGGRGVAVAASASPDPRGDVQESLMGSEADETAELRSEEPPERRAGRHACEQEPPRARVPPACRGSA